MATLTLKQPEKALSKLPEFRTLQVAHERVDAEVFARRRRAWRDQAIRTRRELSRWFPKCLLAHSVPKHPLKIGIDADLAERAPDIGPWSRLCAIQNYVGEEAYLAAMIEGAVRLDLGGNPAGVVTAQAARQPPPGS